MGYRINTNISSLTAHTNGVMTNAHVKTSLERLSSGLRINKAADDASGMAIADNLRSQAKSLGQAISNANDSIGMIQIADKAMDEQVSMLDTIKKKAIQAAADGQSTKTRKMLQQDITKLIENVNNIATQTSYNGKTLLSGAFTSGSFQVGAYSGQSVSFGIGNTSASHNGHIRMQTGKNITAADDVKLKFNDVDGISDYQLSKVRVSTGAGTGIGELARAINAQTDKLHVRASWQVENQGSGSVASGDVSSLTINGINFGTISNVKTGDADGRLVAAINEKTALTGVQAFTDYEGVLHLKSIDGRGIEVKNAGSTGAGSGFNGGRLTLIREGASEILLSGDASKAGLGTADVKANVVNLQDVVGTFTTSGDATGAIAAGFIPNSNAEARWKKDMQVSAANGKTAVATGVLSSVGANLVMNIADSAINSLDTIRSGLGSSQNQIESITRSISVAQVNVKSAESGIRDVDFASESSNFSKYNILAQSGSYALAQANQSQNNMLRLMQ